MNPANFVTGVVIALKGRITTNGLFEVKDYTYPGVPSIESMPQIDQSDYKQGENLSLFENLENREFVAFISGLEFGNMKEKLAIEIMAKFFNGQYGTKEERFLNSRVLRLIIAGNSIGDEKDIDMVIKGSYRTQDLNEKVYNNLSNSIEMFEDFLVGVSQACEVDVIPGENDISGAFFPQQPLNVALFPKLLENENIIMSTNPHKFELKGRKFLGTSGQNIKDMSRFQDMNGKTE